MLGEAGWGGVRLIVAVGILRHITAYHGGGDYSGRAVYAMPFREEFLAGGEFQ